MEKECFLLAIFCLRVNKKTSSLTHTHKHLRANVLLDFRPFFFLFFFVFFTLLMDDSHRLESIFADCAVAVAIAFAHFS